MMMKTTTTTTRLPLPTFHACGRAVVLSCAATSVVDHRSQLRNSEANPIPVTSAAVLPLLFSSRAVQHSNGVSGLQ